MKIIFIRSYFISQGPSDGGEATKNDSPGKPADDGRDAKQQQ